MIESGSPWHGQAIIEHLDNEQLNLLKDSANWPLALRVFTQDGSSFSHKQPVLGSYSLIGNILGFKPRYQFEDGVHYVASSSLYNLPELYFSPDYPSSQSPPQVVGLYPSGMQVPANLLRIYIYFSVPMRADDPYRHVYLVRENGDTIQNILYPSDPALWSPDQKRLTVLFDPGRIKRGLAANRQWGLALEPGTKCMLVIDHRFTDQWGNTLAKNVLYPLDITAPDYQSPALHNWKITAPAPSSRDPLKIVFDEPLDQAQSLRWLKVENEQEQPIDGAMVTGEYETSMIFQPAKPWKVGNYKVKVFNNLEDRSGNSIRKPFEIFSGEENIAQEAWVSLPFTIRE